MVQGYMQQASRSEGELPFLLISRKAEGEKAFRRIIIKEAKTSSVRILVDLRMTNGIWVSFLLKYLTVAEIFSVCGQIKSDWQYANS